jgi:opacity protein-like surface antigen
MKSKIHESKKMNPMSKKIQNGLLGAVILTASMGSLIAQETQIRFFGQPEFQSQTTTKKGEYVPNPANPKLPPIWKDGTYTDSTKSAFNTGNFVLFITSQLTDRISILSENTANVINGNATFAIQRLMAKYYIKDYFSLRVGKMFDPLGYWNNQYNFGLVLQPTIQRPSIIRAPSDGGVLEINNTGIQIEGDNITKARMFYRLFLSNGGGATTIQNSLKNQYALTGALGIEPVDGFKILASAHYDVFNANTPNPAGVINVKGGKALNSNVSVVYMNPAKKFEFIGEYYYQTTRFDSIGEKSSQGLLTYAGYKVTNKFIPYVQYAYLQAGTRNSTDFYYAGATNGVEIKINDITFGMRYKFNANFVVKFEYNYRISNQVYRDNSFVLQNPVLPGYIPGDKIGKTITQGPRIQFAFAF